MKFIADAMLGRLARWLRLLGFDVLYYPDIDDKNLIRISREQERTVLTRDTRLLKRRSLRHYIFIESELTSEQIQEIIEKLDFHSAGQPARCSICNGRLLPVSEKREVKEYVPDFIYHGFNNFIKCDNCGKVYWEGTHHNKIKDRIEMILSDKVSSSDSQEEEGKA
jgi:uncharacterized protein with PIN domain